MKKFLSIIALVALAACASDSEITKLTSAKEDFNKQVQRVVNYELGTRCSATITENCAPQATVDLLVGDVNSCNATIDGGGNSSAVEGCTTHLKTDLDSNKVP